MRAITFPLTLNDPWRTASDAVACQQDLDNYGEAFAVLRGGRMEHIPVERVVIWTRRETNDYPESG